MTPLEHNDENRYSPLSHRDGVKHPPGSEARPGVRFRDQRLGSTAPRHIITEVDPAFRSFLAPLATQSSPDEELGSSSERETSQSMSVRCLPPISGLTGSPRCPCRGILVTMTVAGGTVARMRGAAGGPGPGARPWTRLPSAGSGLRRRGPPGSTPGCERVGEAGVHTSSLAEPARKRVCKAHRSTPVSLFSTRF